MKKFCLIILALISTVGLSSCKKWDNSPEECSVRVIENIAEAGVVTGEGTFLEGTQVNLTATSNSGYVFVGWFYSNRLISANTTFSFEIVQDLTYTAKWSKAIRHIEVVRTIAEAGEVTGAGDYAYPDTVTLTATTNNGYTFLGWYNEADKRLSSDTEYEFCPFDDMTVTAYYIEGTGDDWGSIV